MDTSPRWDADASVTSRAGFLALCLALAAGLTGCRTNPTNPFLARNLDPHHDDARDTGAEEAPLADSLARLQQRGKQFHDATAQATDAARGLGDDARAVAQDATAEVQASATEAFNEAEARGRQMAANASTQVQLDAIASLEELPLEQAGPILLVAMSRGGPVARRAASEQLARRWPPAASYPADVAGAEQQRALTELHDRWIDQYGQIDEAVADAQAQAQRIVDRAGQVVDGATAAVNDAQQQIDDMRQIVTSLHNANLPGAARQRLATSLERAAGDANATVRAQAARAMGEVGDPIFLPALMALLGDQPEVQDMALASLPQVAGRDVIAGEQGRTMSNEEKSRLWQLWYSERAGNVQRTAAAN